MALTRAGKQFVTAAGEQTLVARVREQAGRPHSAVHLGIGDDCALLRIRPSEEMAVTTDLSLENVHFRRDWHPAEAVGHRCLARGLSDLAAMGATPVAAFLSLAVPVELTKARGRGKSWVERFLNGLFALAKEHHVTLAGGDTAESPGHAGLVVADIVLVGSVRRGRAMLRSKAQHGDRIYVSGALGGSAAELKALELEPRKFRSLTSASLSHPHLYPQPRVALGRRLASGGRSTSAIDVSDGLSTDLDHLCVESGLAAEIDAGAIPLHPLAILAAKQGRVASALDLALHGGEDYEALFTAPEGAKIGRSIAGVPVYAIGRMTRMRAGTPRVTLLTEDGKRIALKPGGWEHFCS